MAIVLTRKFGMLAGVCAALYIATAPLFVDNSRDLRGYSLAALCSVLASIVLSTAGRDAARSRRLRLIAYGLLMGLAIAAQLFAIVVLVGHVAWIATRRSVPALVELAPAWFVAALIGVAANANIQVMELLQHGYPPSLFYPTFPGDLVIFLLGAPVALPLGLWLSTAGLGLWALRREPWLWASLAVLAVVVAVLWLGLQPAYLLPALFHLPRPRLRLPYGRGDCTLEGARACGAAGGGGRGFQPGHRLHPGSTRPATSVRVRRADPWRGKDCVRHPRG